MKHADRFLIAIVIGIALIVVAALFVVRRQPEPTYRRDDSPEAAVHNYLLALQQGEYERAYSYLSPTLPGYPASALAFADDVASPRMMGTGEDSTLRVGDAELIGGEARVTVVETIAYRPALFDSGAYDNAFRMNLRREDGAWRLFRGDDYWNRCWSSPESSGCR